MDPSDTILGFGILFACCILRLVENTPRAPPPDDQGDHKSVSIRSSAQLQADDDAEIEVTAVESEDLGAECSDCDDETSPSEDPKLVEDVDEGDSSRDEREGSSDEDIGFSDDLTAGPSPSQDGDDKNPEKGSNCASISDHSSRSSLEYSWGFVTHHIKQILKAMDPGFLDMVEAFKTRKERLTDSPGTVISLRNILRFSWLNWALILVPVMFALPYALYSGALNLIVTLPASVAVGNLANLAVVEISLRFGSGKIVRKLRNALGEAVGAITSGYFFVGCQYTTSAAFIIGSLLLSLLLIQGIILFLNSMPLKDQWAKVRITPRAGLVLVMAAAGFTIPSVYYHALMQQGTNIDSPDILQMSRTLSIVLLSMFVMSYSSSKEPEEDNSQEKNRQGFTKDDDDTESHVHSQCEEPDRPAIRNEVRDLGSRLMDQVNPFSELSPEVDYGLGALQTDIEARGQAFTEEDDICFKRIQKYEVKLNLLVACCLLMATSVLAYYATMFTFMAVYDVIDRIPSDSTWLSSMFLPIFTSIFRIVPIILEARKKSGKDLPDEEEAPPVESGSIKELYILPLWVILGWILNKPMKLNVDIYSATELFLAALLTAWIHIFHQQSRQIGILLIGLYALVVASKYFVTDEGSSDDTATLCWLD